MIPPRPHPADRYEYDDLDDQDDSESRELFASVVSRGNPRGHQTRRTLITVSVGLHIVAVAGLLFHGIWAVDRLRVADPRVAVVMATPERLPPLPEPESRTRPPEPVESTRTRRQAAHSAPESAVRNPTSIPLQPRRGLPDVPPDFDIDDSLEVDTPDSITGLGDGTPLSLAGGLAAGRAGSPGGAGGFEVPGGDGGGGTDRVDARGPGGMVWAPQLAVEQRRISGNSNVEPDPQIKKDMLREGKQQLTFGATICLSRRGEIESVEVTRSTGYPQHDRLVESRIRRWRHRPYEVRGEARPVCTRITLVYRQRVVSG